MACVVCVCTCLGVAVCVYACVWRPEVGVRSLGQEPSAIVGPYLFTEARSHNRTQSYPASLGAFLSDRVTVRDGPPGPAAAYMS